MKKYLIPIIISVVLLIGFFSCKDSVFKMFTAGRPDIASFDFQFRKIDESAYTKAFLDEKVGIGTTSESVFIPGDTVYFELTQYEESSGEPETWQEWLLSVDIEIIEVLNQEEYGTWTDETIFTTEPTAINLDLGYYECKIQAIGNEGYYENLESGYSGESVFFLIKNPDRPARFRGRFYLTK